IRASGIGARVEERRQRKLHADCRLLARSERVRRQRESKETRTGHGRGELHDLEAEGIEIDANAVFEMRAVARIVSGGDRERTRGIEYVRAVGSPPAVRAEGHQRNLRKDLVAQEEDYLTPVNQDRIVGVRKDL